MNKNISKGFTLIEVLVTSILMIALGFGILVLQRTIGMSQVEILKNYISVDQTNSAITRFEKELRTASKSENGAYPLQTINDNEIIFYSDIDYDGDTERVRYYLNNSNFYKQVDDNDVINIAENVQTNGNPIFSYYDGNHNISTVVSDIKLIKLTIKIDDYELSAVIQLRLLKNNL